MKNLPIKNALNEKLSHVFYSFFIKYVIKCDIEMNAFLILGILEQGGSRFQNIFGRSNYKIFFNDPILKYRERSLVWDMDPLSSVPFSTRFLKT